MSGLKIDTAWTASAVATSAQKSFMRVDFSDDDTLIAELIKSAQNLVEAYMNRAITTQTLSLFLDRLPFYSDLKLQEGIFTAPDLEYNSNFIVLPKPPVVSVTHVKYYDNDNTASTFATTNYYVDTISDQARVVLKTGSSWPTVSETRNANAYEIKYVAGYGGASDVPEPIVQAIKLLTTHLYENREAVTSLSVNAIPYTIGALLQPYKVQRLNSILGG
tara:strand:- start:210 stop:866 length:657 start_codon:yes stop_codon:yes gene_type:complete